MRTLALCCLVVTVFLSGCESVPVTALVSGNGSCHPSQDLPATKELKKIPEQDTLFEDFYGLMALERERHAADVRDYNSLYRQCVQRP